MDIYSLQHDLETTHTIELENNKIHIRRDGPYGFWQISLDKGQLPEWMKGEFTSADKAVQFANRWIAEKKKQPLATKV